MVQRVCTNVYAMEAPAPWRYRSFSSPEKNLYLSSQSLHSPTLPLTYFLFLEVNFACSRISYKLNQIVCTLVFRGFFSLHVLKFTLLCMSVLCSFSLLSDCSVLQFINPHVCWWIFGLFLGEVIMNKAATNKQTSLCIDLRFPFFVVNICSYNCLVLREIEV